MNISRDNVSKTKVKLTITLDASELADARDVALTKLARDVKVQGFRKGKAPLAVVAKNVDQRLLAEQVVDSALNRAVAEAFIKEDVQVISRPNVEVTKFVPEQTLEFTAEADILPDVQLGNYKKLKIKKPEQQKITKKEIDEVVDRTRQQFSEKVEVKRAAKTGDEAVIDFVGKIGGTAFDGGKADDYPLTLGSGSFIPGFEEGIEGHKLGETFDIDVTFPADYGAKEMAGKKAVFTVTLKKINEVKLPEANDEFAAKLGAFTSMDDVRADIQRELEARAKSQYEQDVRNAVVEAFVETVKTEVPEVLIDEQVEAMSKEITENAMYRGQSLDDYLKAGGFESEADWREKEAKPAAKKRVTASMALSKFAKEHDIEVSDEDIDVEMKPYKEQYVKQPDMLKQLESPEVRADFAGRVRTNKSINKLAELNGINL